MTARIQSVSQLTGRIALAFLSLVLVSPAFQAHASILDVQAGIAQTIESEIQYRFARPTDTDWQSVLADSSAWASNSEQPFVPTRGRMEVWARFDLPDTQERRTILVNTSPWERVEIYLVHDGRLLADGLTGTLVPTAEHSTDIGMRSRFFHSGFVALNLEPGQRTTVLARLVTSQRYVTINWLRFYLRDANEVLQGERAERNFQGLYLGIMLALVIYNFGLFVALRERSYLYFVLMLTGSAIIWANQFGLTGEYLWPNRPAWEFYPMWAAFGLTLFAAAQFLRHYLDTARVVPRGDILLRWLAIAGVAVTPFALLLAMSDRWIVGFVILVTPTFVAFWAALGIGFFAMRNGSEAARHFLLAGACATAGTMVLLAGVVGWLPFNAWVMRSSQLGSLAMGIILALGLGFKLRRARDDLAAEQVTLATQRVRHEQEKLAVVERQSQELEAKVQARTSELTAARARAEEVLSNILPRAVIEELHEKGVVEPRRHDEASILFTDFVGFTESVATLPAQRLVRELDEIFQGFDTIVESHGLEKIKTIGDAYMAAAGLPLPAPDHAERCVRAGLALVRFIEDRNRDSSMKWGLRVGVHSGSVVAGVVGKHKYVYDVWGDTVNLASRLESASQPNRVNISAYTHDLVRNRFECEYRSKLGAKGKGEIDMYFVLAEKAPLTAAGQ